MLQKEEGNFISATPVMKETTKIHRGNGYLNDYITANHLHTAEVSIEEWKTTLDINVGYQHHRQCDSNNYNHILK